MSATITPFEIKFKDIVDAIQKHAMRPVWHMPRNRELKTIFRGAFG
jgi:hypothetical protein